MTEEGTGSGSGEEPAAGPTLPTPPAPTLIPSTEPTYTHEGDRHRLGYVTDAFVLSDKDTGQTERFALSDEGWRQAWGAFATKEPAAARGVAAVYRGAPTDRGRTSGLAVGPDGWVTATQPRPDGVRAEDWEPGRCQVCGRTPAGPFTFRSNVGMLLARRTYSTRASLCRDCARGSFRAHQYRNLTQGWWGLISLFMTVSYLVSNVGQIRGAGRLAEPSPVVDEDVEKKLRGRPLAARPVAWLTVAGVVALVGWLVLNQTGATAPGGALNPTLQSMDLTSADSGLPSRDTVEVSAGYSGGAYVVTMKTGDSAEVLDRVSSTRTVSSVRVEVSAAKATAGSPEGLMGVRCVSDHDSNKAYEFLIDSDSSTFLIVRSEGENRQVLRRGTNAISIRSDNAVNVVTGSCDGSASVVVLTMSVNDAQVATARDPGGYHTFQGMGLFAGTKDGGTTWRFTKLSMRRL